MKNRMKFFLAALTFSGILGLGFAPSAQAQSAQTTTVSDPNERQSPYQRNQALINQFLQTENNQEAFDLLAKIKNSLQEEIASSKRQILKEKESGNDAGAKKALENTNKLSEIYNQIIVASSSADQIDKATLNATFEAYQKLH